MHQPQAYFRPASERGKSQFAWLDSHHSFSFGHYYDPKHMGFHSLKVINDDFVAPGAGFPQHGHRNMEIISYILEGAIEHRDTLGNQFVVSEGEVQRMSAGTGIMHSEYNRSRTKPLRFLQIWIEPKQINIAPSYEQRAIAQTQTLTPLVTPDGHGNSLRIHQNASIYRLQLRPGETWQAPSDQGQPTYLHVIEGDAQTNNLTLNVGDGLGNHHSELVLTAKAQGLTALLFTGL